MERALISQNEHEGGLPATPLNPRSRLAISLHFLIDGVGFGIWAAFIPTLKQRLALSDIQLSVVLLGMVIGAMVAMPLTGRFIARRGSASVLALVAALYSLALLLPIVAPSYWLVVIAAAIFGALKGSLDVSVNTQAIILEQLIQRPVNASMQGLWSFGGLISAILASFILRQSVSPVFLAAGAGITLLATTLLSSRHLVSDSNKRSQKTDETKSGRRLPPQLLRVGLLAFAALFSEGVMMDWGAIYSREIGLAPEWLAPLAYGVFCCSMAAGRFSGDYLLTRLGSPLLLKISGVAMVAGLLTIIMVHHWVAIFIGLAITGFGTANLVPIFLRAGGAAHPADVGYGVATVSTIGYVGFLAGPPVIGGISECFGLPVAFGMVALFSILIIVFGPLILSRPGAGHVSLFNKTAKLSSQQIS